MTNCAHCGNNIRWHETHQMWVHDKNTPTAEWVLRCPESVAEPAVAFGPIHVATVHDMETRAELFNAGFDNAMAQQHADDPGAADEWLSKRDAETTARVVTAVLSWAADDEGIMPSGLSEALAPFLADELPVPPAGANREDALKWAEGEGFKIIAGKFTGAGPFELNSDPRDILIEAYLALASLPSALPLASDITVEQIEQALTNAMGTKHPWVPKLARAVLALLTTTERKPE